MATYSFRLKNLPPRKVAEKLVAQNIYVWDGNYYALNVTERLELEDSGGMLRIGAVHYNTFGRGWAVEAGVNENQCLI